MSHPSLDRIVRIASIAFGISTDDIMGRAKSLPIPCARWCVWSYFRDKGHTLVVIGRWFSRDHATVRHGLEQLPQMDRDPLHGPLITRFRELLVDVPQSDPTAAILEQGIVQLIEESGARTETTAIVLSRLANHYRREMDAMTEVAA